MAEFWNPTGQLAPAQADTGRRSQSTLPSTRSAANKSSADSPTSTRSLPNGLTCREKKQAAATIAYSSPIRCGLVPPGCPDAIQEDGRGGGEDGGGRFPLVATGMAAGLAGRSFLVVAASR